MAEDLVWEREERVELGIRRSDVVAVRQAAESQNIIVLLHGPPLERPFLTDAPDNIPYHSEPLI